MMKKILVFVFVIGAFLFWKTGMVYAACTGMLCSGAGTAVCSSPSCNTCSFCTTGGTTGGSSIFGTITPPPPIAGVSGGEGIGRLLNMGMKTLIVVAGVYALFNLIFAGYAFMSAGDDAKKVAGAWAKIWQSLLGLAVAAGAFVLAAIFGQLIFGQWDFILNPQLPTL